MSKPEWNEDTPKWANWLAQDLSGVWVWFYGARPYPHDGMWRPRSDGDGFRYKRAGEGDMNMDWRETLEPRP